jgi:hypothetical protein
MGKLDAAGNSEMMSPAASVRGDMAAVRASTVGQPEPVPELPEPLASDPRAGMQRGRAVAAMYNENMALYAAAIAFGEGTRSLHTRLQAMQLLYNMIETEPGAVPIAPPPGNGQDPARARTHASLHIARPASAHDDVYQRP